MMRRTLLATVATLAFGGVAHAQLGPIENQRCQFGTTDTTCARGSNSPFAQEINLNDPQYGCVGDGLADDTACIQAAWTAGQTKVAALPAPNGIKTGSIRFACRSGSVFKLTGPIGGNSINIYPQLVPFHYIFTGCGFNIQFTADNAGKPIFDWLAAAYGVVVDLNYKVSTLTNLPSNGIQVGRISSNPAYHWKFIRPVFQGRVTGCAIYAYSSELTEIEEPDITNSTVTPGSHGVCIDGMNHLNVTSPFVSETLAADTAAPFNMLKIHGGHISSAGDAPLFISNIYRADVDTYLLAQNATTPTECIRLFVGTGTAMGGGSLTGEVDLFEGRVHCEPNLSVTTLPQTMTIETNGANPNPVIKGLRLEDAYGFATTALIGLDASVTTATIWRLRAVAMNLGASVPVFSTADAAKLTLYDPEVFVPASTNWVRPNAMYGGKVCNLKCTKGTTSFGTNTGSGKAQIGDVGNGNYAGIILDGGTATADAALYSSAGDSATYINRKSGQTIHFREGGAGPDQAALLPGGNFALYNGVLVAVRSITSGASDTASATDYMIKWNKASGSASTQNIPACSSSISGQTYVVKDGKGDAGTNNITVTPASGTVDGAATAVISGNYGSLTLVCDGGSDWSIN